jgi:hypothetical protein
MKPHFMIVQSAMPSQERRTELLLRMIEQMGNVSDYHCTLIIQNGEKITNKNLRLKCDIHQYEWDHRYFFPWSTSPRWRVKPKSDLVVCCDNDLLVLRDLNPFLKQAHASHAINALIGLVSPWQNSICNLNADTQHLAPIGEPNDYYLSMWRRLFQKMDMTFPEKLYFHTLLNGNVFNNHQHALTPYYPNHGFMVMGADIFQKIGDVYYPLLRKLNELIYKNYYIVQVAATLAIYKSGVKAVDMPLQYNYVNCPELPEPDDVAVYHYAYTRNSVRDHLKNRGLQNKFLYEGLMV